jgi:hypothetical protein
MIRTAALILLLSAAPLRAVPAAAQDVSVPDLKAAFLANFAKFAEWPESALQPGAVITFCIAGDKAVQQALEASIKRAGGAAASVRLVATEGPFAQCQVLYMGNTDVRAGRRVIDTLQGAPIFTVSDAAGFAEAGGIAELRLQRDGKMRFAINPAAAQRVHVALSAKLLSLATLVKDGPNATR